MIVDDAICALPYIRDGDINSIRPDIPDSRKPIANITLRHQHTILLFFFLNISAVATMKIPIIVAIKKLTLEEDADLLWLTFVSWVPILLAGAGSE